ncbi:Retrovirus-related Pol polyprotein from transposon RE1 [Sesamum angolense]|uniref:Retrovirus-related Pol polyprotein from transposon RE1 n=1 Tax=Sesamum angolense TaxID=2727404 RepID=A0AAE1XE42_9LAMI|nr:Retrovirus-related Pol polyprotein from transposon RE1 [Sesamum angolense]
MVSQTTGAATGVETTAATGNVVDANAQYEKDVLYLHPSDHPGMTLTSMPLDGTNYLVWSRGVYVSLGVKLKLGFIDGTFPRPAAGTASFAQWRRVDLMVTSWIWSSISKEIVEAFMYKPSARDLWLDLLAKYGSSNGSMIYQIRRDISSVSQGTLSVTAYFTKKKKGRTGRNLAANVGDKIEIDSANKGDINSLVSELLKLVKTNNMPADPVTVNFANYVHHEMSLQDQVSKDILATRTLVKKLYVLTPTSFQSSVTESSSFIDDSCSAEPRSFVEAVDHSQWREAMEQELLALEKNSTWTLTPLSPGKRPIGCKWVYKLKLKADARHLSIQQLDINNAFLHGHLDEDLYMVPPEGYNVEPSTVCKLQRSLYGLKQASRQWNLEFTSKLEQFGFVQSLHDYCLFMKDTVHGMMFLLVYVDDIIVIGPSLPLIQEVKDYLHNLFTIKDIGHARYFLGLEIARGSAGIYVAQTKYIMDIITDTWLQNVKGVSTPFPHGLKLAADNGALLSTPDSYRRLVGQLLYLSFTRPDVSHSMQQLSQYLKHPRESHWAAACMWSNTLRVVFLKAFSFRLPTLSSFRRSVMPLSCVY